MTMLKRRVNDHEICTAESALFLMKKGSETRRTEEKKKKKKRNRFFFNRRGDKQPIVCRPTTMIR